MRVLRIKTHVPEEQRGDEVGRRTTRSGMSAARRRGCGDGMNPQLIGNALQRFNVYIVHEGANIRRSFAKGKQKGVGLRPTSQKLGAEDERPGNAGIVAGEVRGSATRRQGCRRS